MQTILLQTQKDATFKRSVTDKGLITLNEQLQSSILIKNRIENNIENLNITMMHSMSDLILCLHEILKMNVGFYFGLHSGVELNSCSCYNVCNSSQDPWNKATVTKLLC